MQQAASDAINDVMSVIPSTQDIENEIHYFHGVIGGHYAKHSPYEWGMLFLICAFTVATIVILLFQCLQLARSLRKKSQNKVRSVVQSQLADLVKR